MEIDVLHRQGKGIREIARDAGVSRNTVRAVLRGEHDGRYGPRDPRPTKLDPYKDYVRDRLASAGKEALRATVLLREIRARVHRRHHAAQRARRRDSAIAADRADRAVRNAAWPTIADRLCRLPAGAIAAARFYCGARLLPIRLRRVHRQRAHRDVGSVPRRRLGVLRRRSEADSLRQSEDDRASSATPTARASTATIIISSTSPNTTAFRSACVAISCADEG